MVYKNKLSSDNCENLYIKHYKLMAKKKFVRWCKYVQGVGSTSINVVNIVNLTIPNYCCCRIIQIY